MQVCSVRLSQEQDQGILAWVRFGGTQSPAHPMDREPPLARGLQAPSKVESGQQDRDWH